MTSLFRMASAAALLSVGMSTGGFFDSGGASGTYHDPRATRPHYTTDKPLSKRAKRRQRGKGAE